MATRWITRKRDNWRGKLNRFFTKAAHATSGSLLTPAEWGSSASFAFRTPFHFPDADTFAALIDYLATYGEVKILMRNEPFDQEGSSLDRAIAAGRRPTTERQNIIIQVNDAGLHLAFEQATNYQGAISRIMCDDVSLRERVSSDISRILPVAPRRLCKPGVPLLEPIRSEEDTVARSVYDATRKARASGALWGFLTSLAVTIVTIVIPALIRS